MKPRLLYVLGGAICHVGDPADVVPRQQVNEGAAWGRGTFYHGEILFFKFAGSDLLGQERCRLDAPRQYHQSAHLGVQTVDGAETVCTQLGAEQIGQVGRHHAYGLDDHHDAVVLIDDVHADSPLLFFAVYHIQVCLAKYFAKF